MLRNNLPFHKNTPKKQSHKLLPYLFDNIYCCETKNDELSFASISKTNSLLHSKQTCISEIVKVNKKRQTILKRYNYISFPSEWKKSTPIKENFFSYLLDHRDSPLPSQGLCLGITLPNNVLIKNPYNPELLSFGASSASIAAGMAHVAFITRESIANPSSFHGVVGFKSNIEQYKGWFTRSVEDSAFILDIVNKQETGNRINNLGYKPKIAYLSCARDTTSEIANIIDSIVRRLGTNLNHTIPIVSSYEKNYEIFICQDSLEFIPPTNFPSITIPCGLSFALNPDYPTPIGVRIVSKQDLPLIKLLQISKRMQDIICYSHYPRWEKLSLFSFSQPKTILVGDFIKNEFSKTSVLDLKILILKKLRIRGKWNLLFRDEILENGKSLLYYNINGTDTLSLVKNVEK